ncbi:hypothetical protein ACQP3J_30290, partial [Escherichia coli]
LSPLCAFPEAPEINHPILSNPLVPFQSHRVLGVTQAIPRTGAWSWGLYLLSFRFIFHLAFTEYKHQVQALKIT